MKEGGEKRREEKWEGLGGKEKRGGEGEWRAREENTGRGGNSEREFKGVEALY